MVSHRRLAQSRVARSVARRPTPSAPATSRLSLLGLPATAPNATVTAAVQRRERMLSGSYDLGPLVGSVKNPLMGEYRPGDWAASDRLAMNVGAPSAANRFVQAARYNTLENRPDEYEDISERNDYYKAVDWLFANDAEFAATPAAKKIKFFGAAAKITGYDAVGGLELSPYVPAHLKTMLFDINKRLFEMNMAVISRAALAGDAVDPRQQLADPTTGLEFDLRMVENEQGEIERLLDSYPMTKVDKLLLNRLLAVNIHRLGMDPKHIRWAKEVFGVDALDFYRFEHRLAIGRAMVFVAHDRPYAEYDAYIKSGRPRYASTPAVRPR